VRHLTEAALEEYALGRGSRPQRERVEEHVERCAECRERLQVEIGIAALVKTAAAKIARPESRGRRKNSAKP